MVPSSSLAMGTIREDSFSYLTLGDTLLDYCLTSVFLNKHFKNLNDWFYEDFMSPCHCGPDMLVLTFVIHFKITHF